MKKLACLGPKGTHSEAALNQFGLLEPSSKYKELSLSASIAEIFNLINEGKVDAGLVPIENNLEGPVTETLDSLISFKESIFIQKSFNYQVKHSLGALKKDSNISAVYSHSQVLGQCKDYLFKNYPQAAKCALESSAASIDFIKKNKIIDAAAIGLNSSLQAANFEIIENNISDSDENITRFILISKDKLPSCSDESLTKDARYITSILIEPDEDKPGILYNILKTVSFEHQLNIRTIHSRPDKKGGFIFFLDLAGHPESKEVKDCIKELRKKAPTDAAKGSKIYLTGSYQDSSPILEKKPTAGIIGANGKMGRWFSGFFKQNGFPVLESDINTKLSPKDLAKKSDIIILSVPIAEIANVLNEIKEPLKAREKESKNCLVIENCSVKESSLDILLKELPPKCEILSLHTMFGGDIENISGENIVFTKTSRSGPLSSNIEDLFSKKGAALSFHSEQEHDLGSAVVQSLVHLLLISYGQTFQNIKSSSSNEKIKMSTPNSRAIENALSRVTKQSDELLFDLQTKNSKALDVRSKFLQNFLRLTLSLARDKEIFIQEEEDSKSTSKVSNKTFLKALEGAREYLKDT